MSWWELCPHARNVSQVSQRPPGGVQGFLLLPPAFSVKTVGMGKRSSFTRIQTLSLANLNFKSESNLVWKRHVLRDIKGDPLPRNLSLLAPVLPTCKPKRRSAVSPGQWALVTPLARSVLALELPCVCLHFLPGDFSSPFTQIYVKMPTGIAPGS